MPDNHTLAALGMTALFVCSICRVRGAKRAGNTTLCVVRAAPAPRLANDVPPTEPAALRTRAPSQTCHAPPPTYAPTYTPYGPTTNTDTKRQAREQFSSVQLQFVAYLQTRYDL